jgi:hypothetical protein
MEDMILQALREMEGRMNNQNEIRFNNVEKRFDTVENRFDKVENRFDAVEERLERMEQAQNSDIVSVLKTD